MPGALASIGLLLFLLAAHGVPAPEDVPRAGTAEDVDAAISRCHEVP